MVDLTDAKLFCQHLRLTQAPKILCGNRKPLGLIEPYPARGFICNSEGRAPPTSKARKGLVLPTAF
eukprot:6199207-Alexandrium_andersonii.AAC.1